jgi:hypothetical protein
LQDVQEQIEDHVSELRDTLVTECGNALQAAYDDWSAKLDEVLDTIEEDAFDAAKDHVQAVVEYALEKCSEAHAKEFDALVEVVDLVDEALSTMKDEVGECQTDVGQEGKDALDTGLQETEQALASALEALDQVRDLLARYTFVSM